jgi:hypothetical protein
MPVEDEMKYRVNMTISGYLEIEAHSKDEAREIVENGYSMNEFHFEDDDIDEIYLLLCEV